MPIRLQKPLKDGYTPVDRLMEINEFDRLTGLNDPVYRPPIAPGYYEISSLVRDPLSRVFMPNGHSSYYRPESQLQQLEKIYVPEAIPQLIGVPKVLTGGAIERVPHFGGALAQLPSYGAGISPLPHFGAGIEDLPKFGAGLPSSSESKFAPRMTKEGKKLFGDVLLKSRVLKL